MWTDEFAKPFLQKIRQVQDTERDLIVTKLKKGKYKGKTHKIFAAGLHEIFKVMEGKRLFGSFGFTLPKNQNVETNNQMVNDCESWKYESRTADYINIETGQLMTNYIPDAALDLILADIDTELF